MCCELTHFKHCKSRSDFALFLQYRRVKATQLSVDTELNAGHFRTKAIFVCVLGELGKMFHYLYSQEEGNCCFILQK